MKRSKKIGISVVAIVAILSVAYKLNDVKQQKKADINLVNKAKSEITVTTTTVKYDVVKFDITYNGTFESSSEVTIVSESQGKVKKYAINEGDFISEGEIIAWLDNDLIGYQLETAEAAWLKTQDELKRFENLTPGESVSTQQLEEIKLAYQNAKSTYLTIKKQYENAFIKAPVSGTVSKRYFEKGSFIVSSSPVADIVNTRKMKFNAWFTAKDLTRIKTGQKVLLTTDLYPGISYEGIIKVIGVKPDNSKRYLVQAEVTNSIENPLFSGIEGTIHIKYTSYGKNLVIPRNCLASSVIEPMVYVISDNTAKLRRIVISEITDSLIIIESGLTNGERVVLSGQINLEDNATVKVLNNQNL
ncbi:MAG: efflux RND transporter periplasmic adaptor subunit [Lentimicrobiaceae bacterium]|nr:efflux RND transporter periplasmic adaptor subunit [Lentimicrobiaceae bacterium]